MDYAGDCTGEYYSIGTTNEDIRSLDKSSLGLTGRFVGISNEYSQVGVARRIMAPDSSGRSPANSGHQP